jgi:hypothetical protein
LVAFGVLLLISLMHAPEHTLSPDGHAQLFVPGPVIAHVAPVAQPPLFVSHGLTAVHVVPVPE